MNQKGNAIAAGLNLESLSDHRTLLAWQRSHMANERTFLAWCRTSISLLALGFVIEKFEIFLHKLLQTYSDSLHHGPREGVILLSLFCFALAGIAVIFSGTRFLATRRHINQGLAVQSIFPDILVVVSVAVVVLLATILSLPRFMGIVGLL